MKKTIILFLLFSSVILAQSDSVHLILDEPYTESLPRNFRKCSGGFIRQYDKMPDTTGLNGLNISGSSQFNNLNARTLMFTILKAIDYNPANIVDVDLRQETHGFVNGMAVSWYGKYDWADVGLTRDEVIKLENHKLDSLKKIGIATITKVLKKDKTNDTFLEIKDTIFALNSVRPVMQEHEVAYWNGFGYLRLTIADHRRPQDDDVDYFVNFISGRFIMTPKELLWLHFHCHAGDGRTTTFMAMYDMIQNAKHVAYDDIIMRQYLIGGIDLNKDDDFPDWDKQYAYERTEFLKRFYEYCRENNDGFKTNYSSWLKK